jgi:uncharacterized membrane protein YdjX (TVP38/TMEM64 family)
MNKSWAGSKHSKSRLAPTLAWLTLVTGAIAVVWSWWAGGIVFELVRTDVDASTKIVRLREFFDGFGPIAPIVYFLLVTIEVVIAPIPGLMLYAPGGIILGAFWGGAISLAGNVVGAGIACAIARSLRPERLERWFESEKLANVRAGLEQYGGWLIFLLRLNPLTSSDVVSYAAGLAEFPARTVMLATAAGMAPLCFAQAWLAENLLVAFPNLIYGLLAACVVYVVLIAFALRGAMIVPKDAATPTAGD